MTTGPVTVHDSFRWIIALFGLGITLLVPVLVARGRSDTVHLKLRLVVPEPRLCLGEKVLRMEAVFSNEDNEPVSIYKSAISDYEFTKTVVGEKQWVSQDRIDAKDVGTGDPALHEAARVVPAHSSLVVPLEYDISGRFFRQVARYSVLIRYNKMATFASAKDAFIGSAGSNEVLFETNECK